MKTLVIDAIVGVGFPTLTLALTAEQGCMATFQSDLFRGGTHHWRRDKLVELSLEELQTLYSGLRAEREIQEDLAAQQAQVAAPLIAMPAGASIQAVH